ncbi:ABC-type glycerol-3-phosphate transport system permease component [Paenibacillus amylolyticus]|uniref:ABC-type glycerol-3-phosphate transport system permease component n=1 Tax=Paenibacillus amylolyticus TaxID=1451 RepID=A0AAP5H255_PAEAM|nr:ABC-type glycerol-3-phosphate transport system permease component [Paenibacillus amylolyticus]
MCRGQWDSSPYRSGWLPPLSPLGNHYEELISGAVLAIVPILILLLFFQRYFISGLTVGEVKG